MNHPIVTHVDEVLARLREASISGPAVPGRELVPHAALSWDAEGGDMDVSVTSEPGELLTVRVRVRAAPGWFTLPIGLGRARFEPGDVLGLAAEVTSDKARVLTLFLRAGTGDAKTDTEFAEPLELPEGHGFSTALTTLEPDDPACADGESYLSLILRFPKSDCALTLHDMRFFVVPAEKGLRSTERDLTTATN